MITPLESVSRINEPLELPAISVTFD